MILNLFWVFCRIGAVTFGGGYAMVSLLERDLTAAGWLTSAEFADIVAVSQATPGPLALNVATYAGLQVAGFSGALAASLGLIAPALPLAAFVMFLAERGRKSSGAEAALRGIRSAAVGLVAGAVLFFFETSVLTGLPKGPVWQEGGFGSVEFAPVYAAIFILAILAAKYLKQGTVRVILGAAVLGIIYKFII